MTDSASPQLEEYVSCTVIDLLGQIGLHEGKEILTQYQRRWS